MDTVNAFSEENQHLFYVVNDGDLYEAFWRICSTEAVRRDLVLHIIEQSFIDHPDLKACSFLFVNKKSVQVSKVTVLKLESADTDTVYPGSWVKSISPTRAFIIS